MATNGLLGSIIGALVLGAALAASAYWVLHRYIKTSTVSAAPIDLTKLSLTVVAGVGGVVALVVAYRRQRDLEQGRFVERFGAAAAQLGSTDVAVRIAGVYAMAGVADESRGLRRQQCIDVLCGYLRLPYDAAHGNSGRTKRVVTIPNPRVGDDLDDPGKVEEHHEYRNNDREVRATIVRVIAAHLRPEAEYSWSANDFDFRTAYLEDVDFQRAAFSGTVLFSGAIFSGNARFGGAVFSETALFDCATFSGNARFAGAIFSRNARFDGATFSRTAGFNDATFSHTAGFNDATFSGPARFDSATFSGPAGFDRATFSDPAGFNGATFSEDAGFDRATFSDTAGFVGAAFSDTARFIGATFSDIALFDSATFSRNARFDRVTFSDIALFDSATFSRNAQFDRVTFSDTAGFNHTTFTGNAQFDRATFTGTAEFGEAMFSGIARFNRATFPRTAEFNGAIFSSTTTFEEVDFGVHRISFADPKRWGPPEPVFDWSADLSLKPDNVEPQDWPPVAVTSAPSS